MPTKPWSQFTPDFKRKVKNMRAGILGLCQTTAGKWEADAKRNRPWQDRTGNARGTLAGRAMVFENQEERYVVGVRLSHGMIYGVWLETRVQNIRQVTVSGVSGPWTMIVRPTVAAGGPKLVRDARKISRQVLGD